ncbi:MAG: DUF1501 domain-containing protein [Pseudomonadota bacterium]
MDRRRFLQATAFGTIAGGTMMLPATANAAWGDFPAPPSGEAWPGAIPSYKILEVFLYGGLSPWETFFHRPGLVDPWYGQQSQIQGLSWACAGAPSPTTEIQDIDGNVALGPLTKPIWGLADRMRIVVMQHGLEPHEAAIPYAITGHVLGRSNFSSLGAAMSHRFAGPGRTTPLAYSFLPNNLSFGSDNFQAIDAVGTHPGRHRPLRLNIGPGGDAFVAQLQRPGMSATNRDAVLDYYRAHYRDWLRLRGSTAPEFLSRSRGFSNYDASTSTLLNAAELNTLFGAGGQVALNLTQTNECPDGSLIDNRNDITGVSMRAAAKLLTLPEADGGARHVCVVDGGLRRPGGAAYDTHSGNNVEDTAVNLWSTLDALAAVVQTPGSATPDPTKINLDDTLIVLKTEFGRTPNTAPGRDHWPQGYTNILIGGPVNPGGGAKVIGSMDASGIANADDFYTPSEVQGALMIAGGLYPFEPENFGVGDMGVKTKRVNEELTVLELWRQILLGVGA